MRNKRFCWVCWIAASVATMLAISGCTTPKVAPKVTENPVAVRKVVIGTVNAEQVPQVENWKATTEKNPMRNGRFVAKDADGKIAIADRVSFRGVMLMNPNDTRPAAAEIIFLQNPDDPDEYGAIWRYRKNFTSDWTVFIKCWGIRRVDGRIDRVAGGDSRSTDKLQFAILLEDGRWEVSPPYYDVLIVQGTWDDDNSKTNLIGFNYVFGFLDENGKANHRSGSVYFDFSEK
ncbi:MAG: hypothetical protein G01um101419_843 [Parcubacteria group bacterium Gr01-1014_19]|nr:MAG: hypothetical protein G01um101419_843 [Parcubacteria group bacterium Gr01-1014_19]